ncbi:MAG TPA: glycosyltransferase family 4 protein [Verrucomicrobiae bacterium]|nr:glycosyltransferase family 4 protein [Verrucomicrobiae bacterium]
MKVLLLNQCFYPDVASTAQHLTDLAVGLTGRGHSVSVVASQRGYDDPTARFPKRQSWNGINILRIPSLGLGKTAKWRRAADFGSYALSCATRLATLPRFDVVVALTSPPLISFLGALFVRLKGGRLIFWGMDLNPDEAIAAGWLRENSSFTRTLERMLKYSLRHTDRIVVLDRFMKDRVAQKGIAAGKIEIIRPWSHDDVVRFDVAGRQSFRERHGLTEKFVVMYSGNHSPCHPLDTLLQAAERLQAHPRIMFCFVGGGSEFKKVQAFAREQRLNNVKCLPYQPLNQLAASLSSADLHVVVMGDAFTGIVHPCKIYNVLMIGLPVLAIGPEESHIADVLRDTSRTGQARSVRHGDVDGVMNYLIQEADSGRPVGRWRAEPGVDRFSKSTLLPRMIELIETMRPRGDSAMSRAGDSAGRPRGPIAQREVPPDPTAALNRRDGSSQIVWEGTE